MIIKIAKESILVLGVSSLIFILGMAAMNLPLILSNPSQAKKIDLNDRTSEKLDINDSPTLLIPALGVEVPIIFSASDRESDIIEDLRLGVSHKPSSAKPGERGNVFIVGHSSNYPWEKGQYNRVFAFLNKLESEDIVFIDYEGKRYEYKALNKKIVAPSDLSVTNPTPGRNLSLMSCYPPGTTFKRLVVFFEQVKVYE